MGDTEEFVRLVRNYISLIDEADDSTAYALLSSCARVLPRIYSAGLDLPDVEPGNDDDRQGDVPSPMSRLMRLFGRYDNYFEVFDPVFDRDSVASSLADDLADIYLDLARPLVEYDRDNLSSAVWQWKFNIKGHCGDHLVDALRVVHRLINDHMPADYRTEIDRAG